MPTHRIAIIGIGAVAEKHAAAIAEIERAELVAASCRTEEKGRRFAERHGCRWYADPAGMLDAERPDAVTVCTPSGAHFEPVALAAKRGVHVLCEKPLEITTRRVDRMREAAEEAGIRLGGIFPQRYNPACEAVHAAAREGRFGSLAQTSAYVPWWRDDAYYAPNRWQGTLALDGGGALMNQAIHGVDLVQWLAGAAAEAAGAPLGRDRNPVEEVFAYTAKRGHDPQLIEVEDTAAVCLRFPDGSLGQLLAATSMYPGTLKRLQIGGRHGTAEILEDQLTAFAFDPERDDDAAIRERHGAATESGGGAGDPMAIGHANHRRNIAAFLEALETDAEPMLSAPEARKAVAIIEAAYASAASGRPVGLS